MRFNVFGKYIEVIQRNSQWVVLYLGNEGTKRLADDIFIPSDIKESQLLGYLSDLCHEWARENHNIVERLD